MKNPKILIVDDDYSFARYAKMILEMNDCLATVCLDAHSVAEAVRTERPDLILMDLNLRNRKGTEAIRELKSNPATRDIPIILCSITHDRGEVKEALDVGAADFLPKPLQTKPLMAVIGRHLASA